MDVMLDLVDADNWELATPFHIEHGYNVTIAPI
jgi:hypothetical protein